MIVNDRIPININEILKYYRKGKSVRSIAKYFRVRSVVVSELLKYHSIVVKGPKKYFDNHEDFFQTIDNEFKAYWLGFLYADGYINNKGTALEVGLAIKDKKHLCLFRDLVAPSVKLEERIIYLKKMNKSYKSCRLSICGKKFVSHLVDKGCFTNKSLTLTFPPADKVPQQFQQSFIRGYFDGDGSVIKTKKDMIAVDFVGTKNVLASIQNIFYREIPGYIKSKIQVNSNGQTCNFRKTGILCTTPIFEFLYKNSKIHLKRKYNLFNKLCRARQ